MPLDDYVDWARANPDFDPQTYADDALARVISEHKMFHWAAQMPKRLGNDAQPKELSDDKFVCRSLAHLYEQLSRTWASIADTFLGETWLATPVPAPLKSAGAQVEPDKWMANRYDHLANERIIVASSALLLEQRPWANRAFTALTNEMTEVGRIRRRRK